MSIFDMIVINKIYIFILNYEENVICKIIYIEELSHELLKNKKFYY